MIDATADTLLLILFITILLTSVLVWFGQPWSTDLLRYLWWRLRSGVWQQGTVEVGDARIHYRMRGKGPVLVLLHGGLSSSLDWYAMVPQLSRQFRLLLIDSRGHGRSSIGSEPLTYHLLSDDVSAILQSLKVGPVHLAGWSDGGNIGLLLGLEQPQLLRSLVAISANAHPDGLTREAQHSIAAILAKGPGLLSRLLYRWRSPHPEVLPRLSKEVPGLWQGLPWLSFEQLSRIHVPTLLVIGEHDDVSVEHSQQMANAMPDATLTVIPSVGHRVPQAAAAAVLPQMLELFAKNDT